jgi:hypothetical protein
MNENSNPPSTPRQFWPPKKSHRWAVYWAASVGLCMTAFCVWEHFAIGNPLRIQMGLAAMNLTGFSLAVGAFWKAFDKN